MPRECTTTSDCRDYCLALDSIGEFDYAGTDAATCRWPEAISEVAFPKDRQGVLNNVAGALQGVLAIEGTALQAEIHNANLLASMYDGVVAQRIALYQGFADAVAADRTPTDAEIQFYASQINAAEMLAGQKLMGVADLETKTRAQAIHDRRVITEHGLLFDEACIETVNRLVDNIAHGRPTLLIGDKGIAKTRMAVFSASIFSGKEAPVVVSGHGNMMTDELVGRVDLVEGEGTVFTEGIVVQCMREGRPLVLDEINLGDQQIIMRLQDILLKKPGDTITLQENGAEITIKRGFCVLATANEASERYQSREVLDPALRDRFDVIPVQYPDIDVAVVSETPPTNVRLALSRAVTSEGADNPHIDISELVRLARLAHATQALYTKPLVDVSSSVAVDASSAIDDSAPLMTDCITPRKMLDLINRVATGTLPGATIHSETIRAISALDQSGSLNAKHAQKIFDDFLSESSS